METLWYTARPFTGAPVKNYLFALDDDNDVLVYDDVASRYTTCHRLTAAEQDEIRSAFARREAERVEQAKRAAEREELAAHIMATGHLAECDYPIKLIVLTGTPLGGSDDPRHEYQRIYHHAAEVALRASARAVPRRLAFDALHMAADALESNVPDRLKVYWTAWEELDAAVPGLDVPVSAGPDELRRIAAELLPPGTGQ